MTAPECPGCEPDPARLRQAEPLAQGLQRSLDLAALRRAEAQTFHVNRVLRAIRDVSQLITREQDRGRLLDRACDVLVEARGYLAVWIVETDESGRPRRHHTRALDPGVTAALSAWPAEKGPTCLERVLSQPGSLSTTGPEAGCAVCPLHPPALQWRSLHIRLHWEGTIYGALFACLPDDQPVDEEEQSLFTELAGDLAFALHQLEITADLARQQALREAEQAVRLSIARMESARDLSQVATEISRQLTALGVGHDTCGIQVVNAEGTDYFVVGPGLIPGEHPFWRYGVDWPRASDAVEHRPWVVEVWREHRPRLDLEVTCLGEVRSLVDVPFSHGTVAIYSRQPRAFDRAAVEAVQRLAEVLSEGFRRCLDLLRREQTEIQLRQAQRLEAIDRLASGVAHDINNVLTVINGYAEFLLRRRLSPEDPNRREIEEILQAGHQAAGVVQQLLAFSRQQASQLARVDLNQVVMQARTILDRLLGDRFALVTRLAPDLGTVEVDPGQLNQVLLNLVTNARDAMPGGGEIMLETTSADLSEDFCRDHPGTHPGPHVCLTVTDHGTGMDEATRERMFDPFFTTKELSRGTGLGLAMVQGMVAQNNGSIWVDTRPGAGTRVAIYLPCQPAVPSGQPSQTSPPPVKATPNGGESILVVEDDPQVRAMLSAVLTQAGYSVLLAEDGEEASRLCDAHPGLIELVLTDVVMPHMSGLSLAAHLRDHHPTARLLFMSGYAPGTPMLEGVELTTGLFLAKPLNLAELLAAVRARLDTRPSP